MPIDDAGALGALLVRMRTIYDALAEHHAGVCILHLDAAIAALETRLRFYAAANDGGDRGAASISNSMASSK